MGGAASGKPSLASTLPRLPVAPIILLPWSTVRRPPCAQSLPRFVVRRS